MDLGPIVDGVTADLRRAGAIGGEDTARLVDALVSAIEPAIRLHLLEALHEAARELEASAAGLSVEIRLDGREPTLSLHPAPPAAGAFGAAEQEGPGYVEDELLRLTVRLPEGLKLRVEDAAARAGASINSWIVTALARYLDAPPETRFASRGRMPKRMTGFVQG